MRIGIDVHSIGSGQGGNETYYRELVRELSRLSSGDDFVLYHTKLLDTGNLGLRRNFRFRRLYPSYHALRIPFVVPWHVNRDRVDVFHAMYVLPPRLKCKTVTTVADIAYEHFPEFFPKHHTAWFKAMIPRSVRKSDHVITVSEYSKRDIVQTYGIEADKVTVTHEGAGSEFFPRDREIAKEELARRYQIEGDFILYLGRLQARKNLLTLVNAFARVHNGGRGLPHKLILAGKPDSMFGPVLSRIHQLHLEQFVRLPGYVADQDVPLFYSAADLFAYPSFFEGFGLPVMEAMACGTPVMTSRGSALEEVAGTAALLVDPSDETSMAGALRRVLEDRELRLRLREAGLARSKQFSFRNTALQTMVVYQQVAGQEVRAVDLVQDAMR